MSHWFSKGTNAPANSLQVLKSDAIQMKAIEIKTRKQKMQCVYYITYYGF
jgi:hypothetical protein